MKSLVEPKLCGIIIMTSKWAWWCFKSPASRLFTQMFIQAQIKENIKAPRHWPLWGEFIVTGKSPAQRASNVENIYLMTSSCHGTISTWDQVIRAAQFSFRPGDNLPLHFGLNLRNPSYIYITACCIVYICSLYHSVQKFTINNPNLCIIGLEIFNWKYWVNNLSGHLLRPSED